MTDPMLEALRVADHAAWDQVLVLETALGSAREVANKTSLAIIQYRKGAEA